MQKTPIEIAMAGVITESLLSGAKMQTIKPAMPAMPATKLHIPPTLHGKSLIK